MTSRKTQLFTISVSNIFHVQKEMIYGYVIINRREPLLFLMIYLLEN